MSATNGLGDTTVVAAQAPIPEVDVVASDGQVEVGGADPLLSTVSTTRLPATGAQAPIGSIQASISSSGRGSEPMHLSSLHPIRETRIPTFHCSSTSIGLLDKLLDRFECWYSTAADRAVEMGCKI